MLDWFNARTGNILRQQMAFSEADLPLLYRVERALQVICDKLQQVDLKRIPRVENLLYFVQNTRKRCEPQPREKTANTAAKTTVRTLMYMPESMETAGAPVPPLPELPEVRVVVPEEGAAVSFRTQGYRETPSKVLSPGYSVVRLSRLSSGGGRFIPCNSR